MTIKKFGNQRGALHIVGIFVALLLAGVLYLLASWSSEVRQLRERVDMLNNRIDNIDKRIASN